MSTDLLELELLVSDIGDFAKQQIENADLSGPRFGAYVKLRWFAQSGTPCYSDCQNILNALQILRDLDESSEIDTFYVAVTAALVDFFPERDKALSDFAAIRQMSAQLARVA